MARSAAVRFHVMVVFISVLALFNFNAYCFSLLGPFESWMTVANGFRQYGDIGGPMELGNEYRWNVPVVTYGFDKSFLDFFGTNGVAAVESAIKTINDLPPASGIFLTNYPAQGRRVNYQAEALSLVDLKSQTLALLLEQLGLAQPQRSIFNLRRWDASFGSLSNFGFFYAPEDSWPSAAVPKLIAERNYDPATFASSHSVNETLFSGLVYWSNPFTNQYPNFVRVAAYTIDPLANVNTAVADNSFKLIYESITPNDTIVFPAIPYDFALGLGGFYTGLTRDDVGGLRYLLSKKNVNFELLLHGVRGKINEAWRPGVEKIKFVRHPYETRYNWFPPQEYEFADNYIVSGRLLSQKVTRTVVQPDFIFYAGDTGEKVPFTSLYMRHGTASWINNASLNGGAAGAGPGVISPPIKITFHKLGPTISTYESIAPLTFDHAWGSFSGSANKPVVFPDHSKTHSQFSLRLRFFDSTTAAQITNHTWHLKMLVGTTAALQISTNQTDWTTLATVTNTGAVTEWYCYGRENPHKFFRVLAP